MTTSELNPVTLTQVSNQSVEGTNQTERPNLEGIYPEKELPKANLANMEAEEKEKEELSEKDMEEVAKFLNESAELFNVSLSFRINDDPDRIVVSVINKDTDEVIRQVPSEDVLKLAARLNEMVGVLLNETA